MFESVARLEIELHDPAVRRNIARLDELLHDDFIEIGCSGAIYDKQQVLSLLMSAKPVHVVSQDYEQQLAGRDLMLMTYRSAHVDSKGALLNFARRYSLWQQSGSGWRLRFHQGTPTDAFDKNKT
jgi:hypothetical protein